MLISMHPLFVISAVAPRRLFLLLQIVFGDDGAEGCSVIDVADVASEYTNLVAMTVIRVCCKY